MSKRINNAFFMRPWAIKKEIFDVMNEVFQRFNRGEKLSAQEIQDRVGEKKKTSADFEIIGDTAFVPIYGIIAKRSSMINGISQPQGTSIEEIAKDFRHAMADENVKRIVLDIDSPGGSVDGVAEMAELIYASRGKKQVIAYANGMMASAAYWIGSAAEKIFASKSSDVGSIGVYATVYDYTIANHNEGVQTHIIKAGKNKAAGHPDKPFTEDDRSVIQEEVNDIYELFMESVARHRGMNAEQSMEVATGRTYIAGKALKLGLIDGIQNLDAEKERASKATSSGKSAGNPLAESVDIDPQNDKETTKKQEVVDMDLKGLTAESLKAGNSELFDAIFAQGKAAGLKEGKEAGAAEAKEAGIKEGKEAGASEERARVLSILDSSKAIPGCEAMAESAIKEGISADEALKSFKDSRLKTIKKVSPSAPGASDDDSTQVLDASLSIEDRCKKEWESDSKVRSQYASLETYTGYRRAQEKGRVKNRERSR